MTTPDCRRLPRTRTARRALLSAGLGLALAPATLADTLKVPQQHPTIAAAIAAASPGDRILVSRGTYVENVLVDVPGLSLVGRQATLDGDRAGPALTISADDVSVSDFTIRNGLVGVQVQADGAQLSRNDVAGCEGAGIAVFGDDAELLRNTVAYNQGHGVEVSAEGSSGSASLSRNTVRHNEGVGLLLKAAHVEVDRNRVAFNRDDGLLLDLHGESGQARSTLRGNRSEGNGRDGLCLLDAGAGVDVLRNRLRGNGRRGLDVAAGLDSLVERNKVVENGEIGVFVRTDAFLVRNNTLEGNVWDGLRVSASLTTAERVVDGNRAVANGRDGFHVEANGALLRDNVSSRNLGDGIDVQAHEPGIMLTDNRCLDNGHEGIDNSGLGTDIVGNECLGNGRPEVGLDIAGAGDGGQGSVGLFQGNRFETGGPDVAQLLDF